VHCICICCKDALYYTQKLANLLTSVCMSVSETAGYFRFPAVDGTCQTEKIRVSRKAFIELSGSAPPVTAPRGTVAS